ncbi:hypothetical protein OEG84_11505 [Hoeflea sp. G2-23]|uniref:Secretion activator protein n=1 Tax=Hoeflea algicola TaxID=2983763 RepID=A0ABT3Z9B6_9HYPH|nr:glycosyl hydrolase 108 family protein [Hoeflea algicola]MCY0148319.1 hypothetical protein [Hoeflea algicola]
MDRNFARALPLVLKHEGGFVNNAKDPGGATNKGVTLATFRRFVKSNGTVEDLKSITDAQVSTVYYRGYWAAVQAHALPAGVDYAVFDFAVNSGPTRAAKYLQQVVGVKVDGRIGPLTVAAVERHGVGTVIEDLCNARLGFLKRAKNRKTGALLWPTFGKGWSRRVIEVRSAACGMIGDPADIQVVPVEIEVEKHVVPDSVEHQVKRKTNLWSWITGIFGTGGVGLGALLGADWQAILAFGGLMLGGLIVILLLRRQIVAAVKDIQESFA